MLVSHTTSIWDIKNLCCESLHDPAVACIARGCSGGISFATCSADGTIRLWDFLSHPELSMDASCSQNLDFKSGGLGKIANQLHFTSPKQELPFILRADISSCFPL